MLKIVENNGTVEIGLVTPTPTKVPRSMHGIMGKSLSDTEKKTVFTGICLILCKIYSIEDIGVRYRFYCDSNTINYAGVLYIKKIAPICDLSKCGNVEMAFSDWLLEIGVTIPWNTGIFRG